MEEGRQQDAPAPPTTDPLPTGGCEEARRLARPSNRTTSSSSPETHKAQAWPAAKVAEYCDQQPLSAADKSSSTQSLLAATPPPAGFENYAEEPVQYQLLNSGDPFGYYGNTCSGRQLLCNDPNCSFWRQVRLTTERRLFNGGSNEVFACPVQQNRTTGYLGCGELLGGSMASDGCCQMSAGSSPPGIQQQQQQHVSFSSSIAANRTRPSSPSNQPHLGTTRLSFARRNSSSVVQLAPAHLDNIKAVMQQRNAPGRPLIVSTAGGAPQAGSVARSPSASSVGVKARSAANSRKSSVTFLMRGAGQPTLRTQLAARNRSTSCLSSQSEQVANVEEGEAARLSEQSEAARCGKEMADQNWSAEAGKCARSTSDNQLRQDLVAGYEQAELSSARHHCADCRHGGVAISVTDTSDEQPGCAAVIEAMSGLGVTAERRRKARGRDKRRSSTDSMPPFTCSPASSSSSSSSSCSSRSSSLSARSQCETGSPSTAMGSRSASTLSLEREQVTFASSPKSQQYAARTSGSKSRSPLVMIQSSPQRAAPRSGQRSPNLFNRVAGSANPLADGRPARHHSVNERPQHLYVVSPLFPQQQQPSPTIEARRHGSQSPSRFNFSG